MTAVKNRLIGSLPSMLTISNIICGLFALSSAIDGLLAPDSELATAFFVKSIFLVSLAVFLDSIDGALARKLGQSSTFGKELDTIADAISFGLVAPWALLLFLQREIGDAKALLSLAQLGCFVYTIATCLRLARFNTLGKSGLNKFQGLPSPAASILILVLFLIFTQHPLSNPNIYWIVPCVLMLTGALMVSDIPYPKISFMRNIKLLGVLFALAAIFGFEYVAGPLIAFYALQAPLKHCYLNRLSRKGKA